MKTKIVMVNRVVKLSESVQIELSTEPEAMRENCSRRYRNQKSQRPGKTPSPPPHIAAVLRALGPCDWRAIARFSGLVSWPQLDVPQQVMLDLKVMPQL